MVTGEAVMRCPFLREAQVKFCTVAAPRKMIVRTANDEAGAERCSSSEHVHCRAMKEFHEDIPHPSHCPFLHETLVQYCSASPETRFIPYSESTLTRCGTENHLYCEIYLSLSHPMDYQSSGGVSEMVPGELPGPTETAVEGIPIPLGIWYANNHMWLDISGDGHAHVGIDGLLARAIGQVDEINYLTVKGLARPSVVLTVAGVDLHLALPVTLVVTGTNTNLRAHRERLTSHPYTLGWLFEGTASPEAVSVHTMHDSIPLSGLRTGPAACRWMEQEIHRLSVFIHDRAARSATGKNMPLLADGGTLVGGVLRHLRREEILTAFNEFFSSYVASRESS